MRSLARALTEPRLGSAAAPDSARRAAVARRVPEMSEARLAQFDEA